MKTFLKTGVYIYIYIYIYIFSICTLSDLGELSNLIGSLSTMFTS